MFQRSRLEQDWQAMSIRNWKRRNRVNFKRYTSTERSPQGAFYTVFSKYILMKRCRIWPSKWSPSLIYHRIKTTHPTVWPQTFFGLATPYSPILQWCWYSYMSCHGDENHCTTSIFILHILISWSTLSSPGFSKKTSFSFVVTISASALWSGKKSPPWLYEGSKMTCRYTSVLYWQ